MRKFLNILAAFAAVALASSASAQFVKDDGTSRATTGAAVSMKVVPVSPGVADLVWEHAGANFLNNKVVPTGITKVLTEKDASGKGTARNVAYASHPDVFAGYQHCVTVAGPVNWAGGKENVKFDLAKMACAGAAPTVTVRVSFKDRDETYGITPVLVKADGQFVAWAWHGMNSHRVISRPGSKNPDWVTLLRVEADGTVRLANDAEFTAYQELYKKYF